MNPDEDDVLSLERALRKFKLDNSDFEQREVSDLLQYAHGVLNSKEPDDYNLCLAAICHIADKWTLLDDTNKQLLRDCIEKSRVFLYDDMLKDDSGRNLIHSFAKNFYTIEKTGTTLTRDQKTVFDSFLDSGRLIVSAPTSFGKTRLLEEILIAKNYGISVIVFPTLALLAEQYKRLKSREELDEYHISTSSKIGLKPGAKYILMLTPERLTLFLNNKDNNNVSIDFFCIDEIYKADQKQPDTRKYFFADILYRLPKYNPNADFYLIGPYLSSFSQGFIKKFDAKFLRYTSEVVQKDHYDLDDLKRIGDYKGITKSATKKDRVTKLLEKFQENPESKSLIFCKDKPSTELVAKYAASIDGAGLEEANNDLADYIAESISPKWDLVGYVRNGVAYHNGDIPRHIQELIVEAFDNKGGKINTLACTTTLIEGVNTNAKNIIFFDGKVARDPIDKFTQKNIEGRAGRLTRHFLGKIYYLDPEINSSDSEDADMDVELEVFGEKKPAQESAIQVEREDLSEIGQKVLTSVYESVDAQHIPMELIKSNKFISVAGQVGLVNFLRGDNKSNLNLKDFEDLKWVLRLAHNFLFNERDKLKTEVGVESYLLPKSVNYILHPKSLKYLIDSDIEYYISKKPDEDVNKVISKAIRFYTKYIEYAWPRYLSAFAQIYNFVQFERNQPSVNFDTIIAKLEYGSAKEHQILLSEAGVPFEIIQKVSGIFRNCRTPEQMYRTCKQASGRLRSILSPIEYRVLRYYI